MFQQYRGAPFLRAINFTNFVALGSFTKFVSLKVSRNSIVTQITE